MDIRYRRIFDTIAAGGSLVSSLESESINPLEFFKTIDSDPDLVKEYMHAARSRSEVMVDDILTISDTDPDWGRAKLRVDTRKWIASKLNPRTYGDRIDVNVNQTIDIGSALNEARQRALAPANTEQTEVIDITPQLPNGETGSKPVDPNEALEIESIDIFS